MKAHHPLLSRLLTFSFPYLSPRHPEREPPFETPATQAPQGERVLRGKRRGGISLSLRVLLVLGSLLGTLVSPSVTAAVLTEKPGGRHFTVDFKELFYPGKKNVDSKDVPKVGSDGVHAVVTQVSGAYGMQDRAYVFFIDDRDDHPGLVHFLWADSVDSAGNLVFRKEQHGVIRYVSEAGIADKIRYIAPVADPSRSAIYVLVSTGTSSQCEGNQCTNPNWYSPFHHENPLWRVDAVTQQVTNLQQGYFMNSQGYIQSPLVSGVSGVMLDYQDESYLNFIFFVEDKYGSPYTETQGCRRDKGVVPTSDTLNCTSMAGGGLHYSRSQGNDNILLPSGGIPLTLARGKKTPGVLMVNIPKGDNKLGVCYFHAYNQTPYSSVINFGLESECRLEKALAVRKSTSGEKLGAQRKVYLASSGDPLTEQYAYILASSSSDKLRYLRSTEALESELHEEGANFEQWHQIEPTTSGSQKLSKISNESGVGGFVFNGQLYIVYVNHDSKQRALTFHNQFRLQ